MDPEEEQARRRRAIADARDLLADMDAAAELRAASSSMPETTLTQSFGNMPLLSSTRSQRWRREAEEAEARHAAAEAERKREEQQIMRERQEAAERAAEPFTDQQTEILGMVIAEERQRMRDEFEAKLAELRTELVKQRGIDDGAVVDLPALPLRKRSNAA
jgi:hypothetical protein